MWFRQSLFVKVWVWAAIFRVSSALVLCSQNLSRELLLALQILTRPEPPPFKFRFGSNSKSGWIILQLHVNIKIGIALEFSKAQIVLCNKWFFSRTWILLWTFQTTKHFFSLQTKKYKLVKTFERFFFKSFCFRV